MLKKGHSSNSIDPKKMAKHRSTERYDQDGRTFTRKIQNRKLKKMGKIDVPMSNSTYRDYDNYLSAKE